MSNKKYKDYTREDFLKMARAEKMLFLLYALCTRHTAKMENMISFSTSCLENPRCRERFKNRHLVCSKCYARRQLMRQKTTREKYAACTLFFTTVLLAPDDVPPLFARYLRFESFGDLINALQVKNYFTIAEAAAAIPAALWTKNPDIIAEAIAAGAVKPANMKIVYSVPEIDRRMTAAEKQTILKKYPFIDSFFFVERAPDLISCQKNCFLCGRCYEITDGLQTDEKLK